MRLSFALLTLIALSGFIVRADEPSKRDAAWVNGRIEAWMPKEEERAFDRIGWAGDVREALRLGKEQKRPVFLFTYDGASLADYRC
jgi:hypothetical protein